MATSEFNPYEEYVPFDKEALDSDEVGPLDSRKLHAPGEGEVFPRKLKGSGDSTRPDQHLEPHD